MAVCAAQGERPLRQHHLLRELRVLSSHMLQFPLQGAKQRERKLMSMGLMVQSPVRHATKVYVLLEPTFHIDM